jgi:type VI secretion system protein ImpE
MDASELFRAGRLRAAIDIQTVKVKGHPNDQAARLFLFELILFSGDADRARKQLDVLRYEKPEALAAVESYRKALDAETSRRKVLAGIGGRPKFLKDCPAHADLRFDALLRYHDGDSAAGDALVDRANAEAPPVTGTLNGEPIAGLRDADDLFGTILEVFAGQDYYWVPLDQIESLSMNPVQTPRDVLWRPANLSLRDGPQGDVLLPGLYPNSHVHPDEGVALGRVTDWPSEEGRPIRGAGSRLFVAGEKWIGLSDWRELTTAG